MAIGLTSYANNLKLWYTQPARTWVEALPIGNSRMGAMIFGGTDHEEIQLNEETFWAGGPHNNDSPRLLENLENIRTLIFGNKFGEAQSLIDRTAFTGQHGMRYLTLGALELDFPGHAEATEYYRDLDISNATATTRYKTGGIGYRRTIFASLTDNVIIMRIEADSAKMLSLSVGYKSPIKSTIQANSNTLTMNCEGVEQEGIPAALRAECRIQVVTDGKTKSNDNRINISEATTATLYIAAATNFVNYKDVSGNEKKRTTSAIKKALKRPYTEALTSHTGIQTTV